MPSSHGMQIPNTRNVIPVSSSSSAPSVLVNQVRSYSSIQLEFNLSSRSLLRKFMSCVFMVFPLVILAQSSSSCQILISWWHLVIQSWGWRKCYAVCPLYDPCYREDWGLCVSAGESLISFHLPVCSHAFPSSSCICWLDFLWYSSFWSFTRCLLNESMITATTIASFSSSPHQIILPPDSLPDDNVPATMMISCITILMQQQVVATDYYCIMIHEERNINPGWIVMNRLMKLIEWRKGQDFFPPCPHHAIIWSVSFCISLNSAKKRIENVTQLRTSLSLMILKAVDKYFFQSWTSKHCFISRFAFLLFSKVAFMIQMIDLLIHNENSCSFRWKISSASQLYFRWRFCKIISLSQVNGYENEPEATLRL